MANATYTKITDKIVASLEAGDLPPWSKPWKASGAAGRNYKGIPYRGINLLVTVYSGRSGPWITFNQCKALGGHVKKGEKGTTVLFYNFIKRQDEISGKNKTIPFCKAYTVFSLEQTEGVPDPRWLDRNASPAEIDAAMASLDVLADFQDAPGVDVEGDRACYYPSMDRVQIPSLERFQAGSEFAAVLFHELAHSTGHSKRLDRPGIAPTPYGSEIYSKEELIAEITSAFLLAEIDCTNPRTQTNQAAYIQGWLKALKDDPAMVVQAASAAQKAADHILGRSPNKASDTSDEC